MSKKSQTHFFSKTCNLHVKNIIPENQADTEGNYTKNI